MGLQALGSEGLEVRLFDLKRLHCLFRGGLNEPEELRRLRRLRGWRGVGRGFCGLRGPRGLGRGRWLRWLNLGAELQLGSWGLGFGLGISGTSI